MRVYTVHTLPSSPVPDRDLRLIREGFCWAAFLVAPLWALWHRLWRVLFLVLLSGIVLDMAVDFAGADPTSAAAAALAYSAIIGFGGNDWRRGALARRGYREMGVVAAGDDDGAVRRFFDLHPELTP